MRASILFITLLLAAAANPVSSQDAKDRSEIDDQYKWDLTSMYADDEAWEADFAKFESVILEVDRFKGRLNESGETLLEALQMLDETNTLYGQLYVFAGLKSFEDQRVGKYGGMFARAQGIGSEYSGALAYFSPEFLTIPDEQVSEMIENTEGLHIYRHYLDLLARERPYTLSEAEEKLLAMAGDPLAKFQRVFLSLNDADLTFGTILNEDAEEVELTNGRYNGFVYSADRRVRRDAWIGLFNVFEEFGNTLASNYDGHVRSRIFFANARGYDSALEASLYGNAIPVEVYTNLISTARDNSDPLRRFLNIRQELLGLDTLQIWDLYAPAVDPVWSDIPWEEAKSIVAEGLAPLGDEYIRLYWHGFDDGWVDVFENRGKRSGAYSWGMYTSKPYFSMNYQGTLSQVFTLAHEYGHSLHSYMVRKTQPKVYGSNRIFLAEVASMTNEAILMQNMLRNTSSRAEKQALLMHYLDKFRASFFRQISFADFEMQAHAAVEEGRPLTRESLNQIYAETFDAYYGDSVYPHPLNASEWSRIPHFLRTDNFYVYQYATSFAAATALAKGILDEGQPAVDRFLEMLRSGDSEYPIELLKKAGVDMTTAQPILDTVQVFEELLAELEKTIAEE
jgi:oligoendopeptidase F